jgi:hypothetical protein
MAAGGLRYRQLPALAEPLHRASGYKLSSTGESRFPNVAFRPSGNLIPNNPTYFWQKHTKLRQRHREG